MRKAVPESAVTLRADSLFALMRTAQAGLGLAALPCYLGDGAGLVRLQGPIAAMDTSLWLLTHDDLRRTARVRAFMDFAAAAFRARRARLDGTAAKSPVR